MKTIAYTICIFLLTITIGYQSHAAKSSAGGTHSTNCTEGMRDLAIDSNSDEFRSMGGHLFIHEMGWGYSSASHRDDIKENWPDPSTVIYETGSAQSVGASGRMKDYWGGKLGGVVVNGLHKSADGVAKAKEIRNQSAQWVAPIESPNGKDANYDWNSSEYDYLRKIALAGGAICTDAPPAHFFNQPQGYRNFLYDQIKWAKDNGLVVVVIVSPHNADDYYTVSEDYRNDLIANNSEPDYWAVENYGPFSSGCDGSGRNHWIGNEDDLQTQLGVARHIFSDADSDTDTDADTDTDTDTQDQCNTTQECKDKYGNTATDCLNSWSDQSVCMCGNQLCEDAGPQPIPDELTDQCNHTQECKDKYGNSATDCFNSWSDQSVCMCGNQPCE